jgi:hypothetical protein
VRRTVTRAVLVAVALIGLLATPVAAHRASGSDAAKGRELVERFFDLLQDQDLAGLRRFLSPAFQLQRANGTFANKAEYLEEPAVVESYELRDLRVTRDGKVIVARYDVVADVTIDGQPQSTEPAPRLSVFTKGGRRWQILAHANFNVPAEEPAQ